MDSRLVQGAFALLPPLEGPTLEKLKGLLQHLQENAEVVEDQNKVPGGRVHVLGDTLTQEEQLGS